MNLKKHGNKSYILWIILFVPLLINSCRKNDTTGTAIETQKEIIKAEFLDATDVRWLAFALEKAKKDNPKLIKQELGEAGIANLNMLSKVQHLIVDKWIASGGTESELLAIQASHMKNLVQQIKKPGFRREPLDTTKWDGYVSMFITSLKKSNSPKTGKSGGKVMWSDYDLYEVEIRGCPVPDMIKYYYSIGIIGTHMELINQFGNEVGGCKAGVITYIIGAYHEVMRNSLACWELAGSVGQAMQELELCNLRAPIPGGGNPGTGGGGDGTGGISLPDLDVSELGNYPKFKALVVDLPNFLKKYPNILKALSYTTGFTEAKITELMQPGKGPKVVVVQNLKDIHGRDILGQFDPATKNLKIDDGYVNGIDIVQTPIRYQAIGLMLTVTTLHEFVHFGRDANQLTNKVEVGSHKYEAGWYFEGAIVPDGVGQLGPDTAVEWLKYYTVKSN